MLGEAVGSTEGSILGIGDDDMLLELTPRSVTSMPPDVTLLNVCIPYLTLFATK